MDVLLRLSFIIIFCIICREIRCNAKEISIPYEGEDVNFNVKTFDRKVFSNTTVWSVSTDLDENLIFNYEGLIKLNGVIYEDLTKKAILFKEKNCDTNCWEVVFGLGTKRKFIKQTRLDDALEKEKAQSGIYKSIPINALGIHNNYIPPRRLRLRNNIDEKFYAKLLIVIDHALFSKLGNDVEYVKKYMSIFWSAVDLQYRNISSPNIEIRITGILVGKDDKVFDYISKNSPDGETLNIEDALHGSRGIKNIILKNTNLTNFDAIVTMTGLNGFIIGLNKVKIGSNGISWNGSICIDEYNFSLVMDDGVYFGVHNAIHEVGHLFGLDHDGAPGNGFFCYPRDYRTLPVMYASYEVKDLEYWSTCSLNSFKIFTSNYSQSWCLKNEYHKQKLSI